MPSLFNADEIFKIAVQMERNGATFYEKAAENEELKDKKDLLLSLAQKEREHEQTFDSIKSSSASTQETSYDPDGEAMLYLKAIVGDNVFSDKEEFVDFTDKTIEDILITAITKEKESILFYLGLKKLATDDTTKKSINKIIDEEMGHVTELSGELTKLKN